MGAHARIDRLIPTIEAMTASGKSDREICERAGIARNTLVRIRRGQRVATNQGRCPRCNNLVSLPCVACSRTSVRSPQIDIPPPFRHYRFTSRPLATVLALVVGLWSIAAANAAEIEQRVELTSVRVIDGDTLEADVELPFGVCLRGQPIRCSDYDAWESRRIRRTVKITDEEIEKGKRAAAELAELLTAAERVWLVPDAGRDPYGRRLGVLRVLREGKETEVGAWMRASGHVRKE